MAKKTPSFCKRTSVGASVAFSEPGRRPSATKMIALRGGCAPRPGRAQVAAIAKDAGGSAELHGSATIYRARDRLARRTGIGDRRGWNGPGGDSDHRGPLVPGQPDVVGQSFQNEVTSVACNRCLVRPCVDVSLRRPPGRRSPAVRPRAADARYLKGVVVSATDRASRSRAPTRRHGAGFAAPRTRRRPTTTVASGSFCRRELKPGDALFVDAEKEGYRIWQPLDGVIRVPTELDKACRRDPAGAHRLEAVPLTAGDRGAGTDMMARAPAIRSAATRTRVSSASTATCASGPRGTASPSRR